MKMSVKSFVLVKQIKLLCASMLMLGASAVYADPAIFADTESCGFLDGNGNGFSTTDIIVVNANNIGDGVGNINLKCHATEVPNDTGDTVKYDFYSTGARCFNIFFAVTTEDWKAVIDPEGNAVLSCKFRFD